MKYLCIKEPSTQLIERDITKGKTYEVIERDETSLRIKEDDKKECWWYPVDHFKKLKE